MKKIFLPLVCLSVFTISCGSDEKTVNEKTIDAREQAVVKQSTIEELGASVILAFKENDVAKLNTLFPETEDVEKIVSVYSGSEKEKKSILGGSEENTKKIQKNTIDAFSEILNKGNKEGIKWDEVVFSNVEYTTKNENNIETTDLKILFSYKENKYKIRIAECINTERGWLIFDRPQWF